MRKWLFYREKPEMMIEFCRVEGKLLSTSCLPDELRGLKKVPHGTKVEEYVKALVKEAGWVGEPARPRDSELGNAMLRERW